MFLKPHKLASLIITLALTASFVVAEGVAGVLSPETTSFPPSCFDEAFELGSKFNLVRHRGSKACNWCDDGDRTGHVAIIKIQLKAGETSRCSVKCDDVCEWLWGTVPNSPLQDTASHRHDSKLSWLTAVAIRCFEFLIGVYNEMFFAACLIYFISTPVRVACRRAVHRVDALNLDDPWEYFNRLQEFIGEELWSERLLFNAINYQAKKIADQKKEIKGLQRENGDLRLINENVMVALAQNAVCSG